MRLLDQADLVWADKKLDRVAYVTGGAKKEYVPAPRPAKLQAKIDYYLERIEANGGIFVMDEPCQEETSKPDEPISPSG